MILVSSCPYFPSLGDISLSSSADFSHAHVYNFVDILMIQLRNNGLFEGYHTTKIAKNL